MTYDKPKYLISVKFANCSKEFRLAKHTFKEDDDEEEGGKTTTVSNKKKLPTLNNIRDVCLQFVYLARRFRRGCM